MLFAPLEPGGHLLCFQKMLKATKRLGSGDVPFCWIFIALPVPEEVLNDGIFRTGVVRITSGKTGVTFVAKKHQPSRVGIHQGTNRRPASVRVQPDFAKMRV